MAASIATVALPTYQDVKRLQSRCGEYARAGDAGAQLGPGACRPGWRTSHNKQQAALGPASGQAAQGGSVISAALDGRDSARSNSPVRSRSLCCVRIDAV